MSFAFEDTEKVYVLRVDLKEVAGGAERANDVGELHAQLFLQLIQNRLGDEDFHAGAWAVRRSTLS